METPPFLKSARFEFERYKTLGDQTLKALTQEQLHWRPHTTDNSVALLVQHMAGNMKSRWTNIWTEDGEKPWRKRETEFTVTDLDKAELLALWESGWDVLFSTMESITKAQLHQDISIRNEKLTLMAALHRQLAHYAYHVGQMVYLDKMMRKEQWSSLSIPPGGSEGFNAALFGRA